MFKRHKKTLFIVSFYYTCYGDSMTIYVDLIILLNFFLDFILLLTESLLLKRNVKIINAVLGAFIGGISIVSLFYTMSSFNLFIFKVIISIMMILVTFKFKSIKYFITNILYLYLLSIILGGFLYFINNSFSYHNSGLIFFHNGFSMNIVFIILISPIILFMYYKSNKNIKNNYNNRYKVEITFLNGKKSLLTGFLDTGNNLIDPYKKRPIILLNKDVIVNYNPRCILVPCVTINQTSMIKCFRIKKLIINGKKIEDEVLVGLSDNYFNIEGVDLLIHKKIIEGID